MVESMIERAAMAAKQALLADAESEAWVGRDDEPDDLLVDGRIRLTVVVRAVLEAIREPSEAMIEAGALHVDDDLTSATIAYHSWKAMIDTVLAQGLHEDAEQ